MNLAPIVLFVYNRPWHTLQTLEALNKNVLADQTTIYIYSDGPKENASTEDLKNINEVRTLIRQMKWCKEVIITERKVNFGLADSVIQGVSEIIEIHGKVIVLEDDILTGKYFLKFMNEVLHTYKDYPDVFGTSGYRYPSILEIKDPTFFLPIASSWSFATWKNRWEKVNFNGEELIKKIEEGNHKKVLDFGGNSFFQMLRDQVAGKNDSWAIRFYVSMFFNKAYFLYPNKSLVTNIGFDNTGTHCGTDNYYSKSLITQVDIKLKLRKVELNKEITKSVEDSFLNRNFKKRKPISISHRFKQILKFKK